MNDRLLAILQWLGRTVKTQAWGTPRRRWTTGGGLVAGAFAVFCIPAMGLAIAGTAYAIWWWVATSIVTIGSVIGNTLGAGRAKRALQRETGQKAPKKVT